MVGRPRQEDHYIGEYLQDLFSPLYPLVMNGVERVWAYDDAGVHTLASAVVKERYRKEAFMAAMRILGEGQLSLTKFLLVTDARLPLRDFRPLLTHILERADFSSDLFVFSPVSQDTLDYTSNTINEGSKAVLMGLGDRRFTLQAELRAELKDPIFRTQKLFSPGVLVVEGPAWHETTASSLDYSKKRLCNPSEWCFWSTARMSPPRAMNRSCGRSLPDSNLRRTFMPGNTARALHVQLSSPSRSTAG